MISPGGPDVTQRTLAGFGGRCVTGKSVGVRPAEPAGDAAFHRGGTALEAGDADAANDMVEVAARVADRLRQPRLLWRARLMQTAQAVFRGALDDADYFAAEAVERTKRNRPGVEFKTDLEESLVYGVPETLDRAAMESGND